MARGKAAERGLTVEFQVKDAMTLRDWDKRFATVIDSGLFHVLSDEDRIRYVAGLTHVTEPGGRLLLLCFSDEEPGTQGPRRVSQQEIRTAFDDAWTVEEIRAGRADVRPDLEGLSFSEGGLTGGGVGGELWMLKVVDSLSPKPSELNGPPTN